LDAQDRVLGAANGGVEGEATQLKYGVVEDVGEGGQSDLRWISVQVSREPNAPPTLILATSLYSFKSARAAAAAALCASPERSIGAPLMSSFERIPKTVSPSSSQSTLALPMPPPHGEGAVPPVPPDLPAVQPVGQADLIDVVSSLLSRANIPIDLDSKKMLKRLMELDATNKSLETDVASERAVAESARRALASSASRLKCQICISNSVTNVIVPCGHTICESCLTSLNRRNCPFCRNPIGQSCRFYLEGTDEA
jgi:hypothetical protein